MSNLKVLIVDDDGPILKALNLRFQHSGFDVLCAKDGMSAMSIVAQEQPDVAVLDINLPGIDGFSLHDKIRASSVKDIPILFMSASKSEEVLTDPHLKVSAAFYEKPFDAKAMVSDISGLLKGTKGVQAVG